MTEAQANEALLQLWNTGWSLKHPDAPGDYVFWTTENEVSDSLAEYVRVTIIPTGRRNRTIGAQRIKEMLGFVAVQIFTRAGTGTQRLLELCDDVRTVLENKSAAVAGIDERICLYTGASGSPSTDAVWQMRMVNVAFSYLDVSGS